MDAVIRAAGGVVWRAGAEGAVQVLLVHRPHYDDWTFPKGKNEPGEADEACALREVEEETGLRCLLGDDLGSIRYVDGRGRDKVARYWAMTVTSDGPWEPGDEVDERAWLPLDDAERRLSYPRDLPVLEAFRAVVASWAADG